MGDSDASFPHFSGDKGWICNSWEPVIDTLSKEQEGDAGWIMDDYSEPLSKKREATAKQFVKKNPKSRYHAGRQGWVAADWHPDIEEGLSKHREKLKGIVPSSHNTNELENNFFPRISVAESADAVVVEAEVAGVPIKNLSVELIQEATSSVPLIQNDGHQVTPIKAIITPEKRRKATYLVIRGFKPSRWDSFKVIDERDYGVFERRVLLGYGIPLDAPIQAKVESGVIIVFINKHNFVSGGVVSSKRTTALIENSQSILSSSPPSSSSSSSAPVLISSVPLGSSPL